MYGFTFFCLDTKESNKEKIKTDEKFFEKLHSAHCMFETQSQKKHFVPLRGMLLRTVEHAVVRSRSFFCEFF
jgi:hypothetical protein